VFAGFAVFIWWRWCRDELERRRMVDEAVGDAGQDAGQDPGQDAGQDAAYDRPGDSGGPEVSGVTGVRSSP
jgi:hypothetical protein